MKHIINYLGALLAVVLIGTTFTACSDEDAESANVGLGIKTFFPTKVVTNQPMTINGSGFDAVTEIEFPGGKKVTDFEIVSNDMIRVNAPSGIDANGGKIVVHTGNDQAESRQQLTLGHTNVTGFDKQPGETVKGGELITVFGSDLEFINSVELLDADGVPQLIDHKDFYRKGTSEVKILVPQKNIFKGNFAGTLHTYDGQEITMPELAYEPGASGGHWETVEKVIWENPDPEGLGVVNWNGVYRFCLEGTDTNPDGKECIAEIPAETWERMKTEKFYIQFTGSDWFQVRIVTGWWNFQWPDGKDNDITPNYRSEMIIDNGDGTYHIELDLNGSELTENMDAQHLLFTGAGYTPMKIYFLEDEWVEGGGGHMEIVKTSVWKNSDPEGLGVVNWNGVYRFCLEGTDTNPDGKECIAEIPAEIWEKMKTEKFCIQFTGSDWFQVRIATGWWNFQWPDGKDNDISPNYRSEMIIDNGDGTYHIEIDLKGSELAENMDAQHLLFTGAGYTPLEIYFEEETWVEEGESGPKEIDIWKNSDPEGLGKVNWNGVYRFCLEGTDTNPDGKECIAEIPAETWEKIKTQKFYIQFTHDDWFQVRIATGWWNFQWPDGKDNDISPNYRSEMIIDNGDGTCYIEVDLKGSELSENVDAQHLLFTGAGYTPMRLYFKE